MSSEKRVGGQAAAGVWGNARTLACRGVERVSRVSTIRLLIRLAVSVGTLAQSIRSPFIVTTTRTHARTLAGTQ